jgi:glycosyltransferase involved in cell wall biosynthesis
LRADEFVLVAPNPDAADFIYVGELRAAKGVDTLIEAVARLNKSRERALRVVLVGSGPDKAMLAEQARRLGVADRLSFLGAMPIRSAMALGRVLVVPSREPSRCLTSCWKRPRRGFRWSPLTSGESRRFTARSGIGSAHAATPPIFASGWGRCSIRILPSGRTRLPT